jgi:hypothetical protein
LVGVEPNTPNAAAEPPWALDQREASVSGERHF